MFNTSFEGSPSKIQKVLQKLDTNVNTKENTKSFGTGPLVGTRTSQKRKYVSLDPDQKVSTENTNNMESYIHKSESK